jgi:hypothetical protein
MAEPGFDQRFRNGRGMAGHASAADAFAEAIRQEKEAKGRPVRLSGTRVG